MTLYEITGELVNLLQLAEEEDIDPEVMADTMEAVGGEFEDKADQYAKVIRTLEGDIASIKSEIDRLTAKKRTIENNIASIKGSLEHAMITADKRKFKTALFTFGIQKNPPAVVIDDEAEIPAEFYIEQDPKLDRTALKNYLKDNEAPYAHLAQTESLRIR